MDLGAIGALILGFGAILLGNIMEGGHISGLMQHTAAIIVFGGTFGAMWLSTPAHEIKMFIPAIKLCFKKSNLNAQSIVDKLIEIAQVVRKESVLSIEKQLNSVDNDFLAKGLRFIVDGYDPKVVRSLLETEISMTEERYEAQSKMFDNLGGFCPTVGIIGAVLGLIHVMSNLDDPSKLGSGIAVAFVATVYGVGGANLVFIPMGNRIKRLAKEHVKVQEMMLEGMQGIQEGLNPKNHSRENEIILLTVY